MQARRARDRVPHIASWSPSFGPAGLPAYERAKPSFMLIDPGGPGLLLIPTDHVREIPRGEGGEELSRRVRARAARWLESTERSRRRTLITETLVLLAEELSRIRSSVEVIEALLRHGETIFGCRRAFILAFEPSEPGGMGTWRLWHGEGDRSFAAPSLSVVPFSFAPVFVRREAQNKETGSCFSLVFDQTDAHVLCAAAIAEDCLLVVAERRGGAEPDADDWYVLRTVARFAQAALSHSRMLDEIGGG